MGELERIALAAMLALLFLLFTWFCYHRHGWRPRRKAVSGNLVIAYASQSGRSHALAEQCWRGFEGRASLINVNQLSPQTLSQTRQLLIFASTYGEGEAPDNGALFEKNLAKQSNAEWNFASTEYAVIALGDSYYTDFCAYGYRVHSVLERLEARPLAQCITLDASKPEQEQAALLQVQRLVHSMGGNFIADSAEHNLIPERHTVSLLKRKRLNPKSPGAPLYHLQLTSAPDLSYSAGDIAEVFPRHNQRTCQQQLAQLGLSETAVISVQEKTYNAIEWLATRQWPLPDKPADIAPEKWLAELPEVAPRQYTIANAFDCANLQLVVRQQVNQQGELGLASGWLTEHMQLDEKLEISVLDNQEFHTPPPAQPLILIGNGSGIAGLRAHWQQRARTGGEPVWLLYGERDPHSDKPFADECAELKAQGVLQQIDLVYSRNGEHSQYVQDRLLQRGELLQQWLQNDACIYVCGSRVGMGQGVHSALQSLLGEERLQQLQADGRYRRDVY
ncbi:NADPH cytochrome P450 oxidoreductase family protein [Gilvimarinus sp. DA14]|uniref:NADPH cytochrome P450 oxidoreductase family protein n=1 Tax=Gilvimarinus sp. DA14 TaxID=2956798 RepID=UPI0020B736E3|nr:NADPH cytochrome P450 oxidoreductase family protein [Gilvimarinus sp. DA14]UTF60615.1 NADPH cytochrome P450 oxidoreductase family protein [Gilvimarinus sp. DA14]